MPLPVTPDQEHSRTSRPPSRCARWLGFLACGVLLQASATGCSGQFLSDLQQSLTKGIEEGITNLAQALALNLFA